VKGPQAERFEDLVGKAVSVSMGRSSERDEAFGEAVRAKYLPMGHPARTRCLDALYDTLLRVIGEFEGERERITRGAVLKRLDELADTLSIAERVLGSLGRTGFVDDLDMKAAALVAEVGAHDALGGEQKAAFAREVAAVTRLRDACSKAIARVENAKDRTGRPPTNWYRRWVDFMVWMAKQLDIKVTTQGDRSDNPADTPFVRMVFDFEKLLPRPMRVKTLAGCHRRIMRSGSPALKKQTKTRLKK
jgi:hypothetical protein